MKLAIVGSTSLYGKKVEKLINKILDRYKPELVISGGAAGIDSIAVYIARQRGIHTLEFIPDRACWYYYKKRNKKIAEACDALVRIYANNTRTYGSGWTRDYAAKLGKPTEEICIYVTKPKV